MAGLRSGKKRETKTISLGTFAAKVGQEIAIRFKSAPSLADLSQSTLNQTCAKDRQGRQIEDTENPLSSLELHSDTDSEGKNIRHTFSCCQTSTNHK